MFPTSWHIEVLDSCPSSSFYFSLALVQKWRRKEKMMVAFWNAWDHNFIYFHIYTSSSFTKDLNWLFGSTKKKKGGRTEFSLCHPQSNNNKNGCLLLIRTLEITSSPPMHHGMFMRPGWALLSEGTRRSSSVHCHHCVTMGRPLPPELSFSSEKCGQYSYSSVLSLCVKILASMYKIIK